MCSNNVFNKIETNLRTGGTNIPGAKSDFTDRQLHMGSHGPQNPGPEGRELTQEEIDAMNDAATPKGPTQGLINPEELRRRRLGISKRTASRTNLRIDLQSPDAPSAGLLPTLGI